MPSIKNTGFRTFLLSMMIPILITSLVFTFVFSFRLMYAKEHYETHRATYTTHILTNDYSSKYDGYGCKDDDCKYCLGRYNEDRYENFVYYKTSKITLIVFVIIDVVAFASLGYVSFRILKSKNTII